MLAPGIREDNTANQKRGFFTNRDVEELEKDISSVQGSTKTKNYIKFDIAKKTIIIRWVCFHAEAAIWMNRQTISIVQEIATLDVDIKKKYLQ